MPHTRSVAVVKWLVVLLLDSLHTRGAVVDLRLSKGTTGVPVSKQRSVFLPPGMWQVAACIAAVALSSRRWPR